MYMCIIFPRKPGICAQYSIDVTNARFFN